MLSVRLPLIFKITCWFEFSTWSIEVWKFVERGMLWINFITSLLWNTLGKQSCIFDLVTLGTQLSSRVWPSIPKFPNKLLRLICHILSNLIDGGNFMTRSSSKFLHGLILLSSLLSFNLFLCLLINRHLLVQMLICNGFVVLLALIFSLIIRHRFWFSMSQSATVFNKCAISALIRGLIFTLVNKGDERFVMVLWILVILVRLHLVGVLLKGHLIIIADFLYRYWTKILTVFILTQCQDIYLVFKYLNWILRRLRLIRRFGSYNW